ncbi:methyl-CpG-binding domain protein 1 isoform X2 [Rhinatrema bivittatum]|uniref:methyl-CpG-binding domain protein 1 isoform X2 n=1 Tax=Rhinatrema bivittatum TaxID=194408 RepID=UPI001125C629|nr:methyl-CpG-binding domain protein 1 isoform X2 [Rhinatrema bivittatum]
MMTEDWTDCPLLGPGWKRREAFRKSGATCGRTDTYYQSPTGERFRSKIELTKFLGSDVDLTLFDFKNGVLFPPGKVRKGHKRRKFTVENGTMKLKQKKKKKKKQLPPPLPPPPPSPPPPLLLPSPPLLLEPFQPEAETLPPPPLPDTDTVVCCEGCRTWFSGINLGRQKAMRWYCPDCRAERRAFTKQQRYYKTVGCGVCAACQISEDCGYCTICMIRARNPQFGNMWKCLKRRCLRIVKKGQGCGICQACRSTEDCGNCWICVRRRMNTAKKMKRQWKCVKRRCLRKKKIQAEKKLFGIKKLTVKWKWPIERDTAGAVPLVQRKKKPPLRNKVSEQKMVAAAAKRHFASRRRNRKCGECEACLQKIDCGKCDFCHDKPKFGGRNLKRQKCRWRQCLRFAMKRLLPTAWNSPGEEAAGTRAPRKGRRKRSSSFANRKLAKVKQVVRRRRGRPTIRQHLPLPARAALANPMTEEKNFPLVSQSHGYMKRIRQEREALKKLEQREALAEEWHLKGRPFSPLRVPVIKLERLEESNGFRPVAKEQQDADGSSSALSFFVPSPMSLKQEMADGNITHEQTTSAPKVPHFPLKVEESLAEDDVAEADQSTPVIMEIFSLGSYQAVSQLDGVLREFLTELNEIPLPAHWEVLPLEGPDLRLIQRSALSTVAEAVIHIEPGLHFHILIHGLLVPASHELYANHPSRLTTVDEVVELICDLEAYRPCAGVPKGACRATNCAVLAYGDRCSQCCMTPWPSGDDL